MKLRLLIALILSNVLLVYSQENILDAYNGDFENGITHWRFFEVPGGNGSFAATTTDAVSGNVAMELNFTSDYGNIIDRGFDNWDTGVPVKGGELYTLKAFVKADTNSSEGLVMVRFSFGFFDASGAIAAMGGKDHPLTHDYLEKSYTVKAPDQAATCWVAFRLFDATDPCAPLRSMYIDHVRILRKYGVSVESPSASESETINLTNYPNPFNLETTISYNLGKSSTVTLGVYDILGQAVALLLDQEQQTTGNYKINWVPENLASGIYLYRLEVLSSDGIKSEINRKMVLGK